jgi:hypothetical protein
MSPSYRYSADRNIDNELNAFNKSFINFIDGHINYLSSLERVIKDLTKIAPYFNKKLDSMLKKIENQYIMVNSLKIVPSDNGKMKTGQPKKKKPIVSPVGGFKS